MDEDIRVLNADTCRLTWRGITKNNICTFEIGKGICISNGDYEIKVSQAFQFINYTILVKPLLEKITLLTMKYTWSKATLSTPGSFKF